MAHVKSSAETYRREVISCNQLKKDLKKLAWKIAQNEVRMRQRYSGLFGIPRNGTIIAGMLSHLTGLPLLEKPIRNCIIIDDLVESGKSLDNASWIGKYLRHTTAVLYKKDSTKLEPDFFVRTINAWIQLPFETKESSKIDYKARRMRRWSIMPTL